MICPGNTSGLDIGKILFPVFNSSLPDKNFKLIQSISLTFCPNWDLVQLPTGLVKDLWASFYSNMHETHLCLHYILYTFTGSFVLTPK